MLVREKNASKDAEPISMGWDEAQAAIAAGTHVAANDVQTDDAEAAHDGLEAMNKADLERLAAERNVDISEAKTKAEIIDALRKTA